MSDGAQLILGILIGYCIGTFPSADLVTRIATRGQLDIRESGSGNPGGLNAARVLGKKWGLLVIVLDASKGALAGVAGLALGDAAAYAAGTGVVAGHCWPVWTGFRGGKGVASGGGSFISVFPPLVPLDGAIALGTAALTRRSDLTVRVACLVWVAAAALWWAADLPNWWGPEPGPLLLLYAVLGAGMILVRFRMTARAGGASL